jgi:hypothetical protein
LEKDDDGGIPGPDGSSSGNHLGQVILRGSSWRVITVRSEPRERKARLITYITSTVLRKQEKAVHL